MRTPNLGTAFYVPGDPPSNADEMQRFLRDETQKISSVIALLAAGHLDKVNAAPAKPREGDIRFADGTNWNPGSGEGAYIYRSAAWHFLG